MARPQLSENRIPEAMREKIKDLALREAVYASLNASEKVAQPLKQKLSAKPGAAQS